MIFLAKFVSMFFVFAIFALVLRKLIAGLTCDSMKFCES
jgi:hypothetical protein